MATIPTSQVDHLSEDPELRGQKYVCLSFLSPEDVLANKDAFLFERYVQGYAKNMAALFDGLKNKFADERAKAEDVTVKDNYKAAGEMLDQIRDLNKGMFDPSAIQDDFRFFKSQNYDELEREFHEQNAFRTTVRGIKVRGVFETIQEAQARAEYLKKEGDKFDIFVGQVGCWCPWSPNPELLDAKYAEEHLNTLMARNVETMSLRDSEFEKRKAAAIAGASTSGSSE